MQPRLLTGEQLAVGRFLQQRMPKRIGSTGAVGHQHAGADRLAQAPLKVGLGPSGGLGEQLVRHPPACHCRHPQYLLGRLRQPLDPGQHHISQGGRQGDLGIAGPGGQQLLGVERVALRAGMNALHPDRRQSHPCDRLQVLGEFGPAERGKLNPLNPG